MKTTVWIIQFRVIDLVTVLMIIFSTGASTLTYILNDMMDLSYGIWAGCFCIMGSILGMLLLDMIIKILERQSP